MIIRPICQCAAKMKTINKSACDRGGERFLPQFSSQPEKLQINWGQLIPVNSSPQLIPVNSSPQLIPVNSSPVDPSQLVPS